MSTPLVSVLVPCHDLGAYLDEAVDSVLAQTVDDVEILVVDDGSTDPDTVARLAAWDRPETTLLRTENRGLAAARNLLLERARGRFVAALDADDRLHPAFLERCLAAFDEDPDLTFVSAWLEAFGTESWQWTPTRCDLATLLAEDTVLAAALVRRDAVQAVGGWDEGMPAQGDEDWDLWIRLVAAGHRGRILPEILFSYRRRPGSMSTVCTAGSTHLTLLSYLMTKHEELYRTHLLAVLDAKDREIAQLSREVEERELRLGNDLEPDLRRRWEEVARLEARLAGTPPPRPPTPTDASTDAPTPRGEPPPPSEPSGAPTAGAPPADPGPELEALRTRLAAARAEIAALRASKSWLVTAPLRALLDRWLALRRRVGRRRPG